MIGPDELLTNISAFWHLSNILIDLRAMQLISGESGRRTLAYLLRGVNNPR